MLSVTMSRGSDEAEPGAIEDFNLTAPGANHARSAAKPSRMRLMTSRELPRSAAIS